MLQTGAFLGVNIDVHCLLAFDFTASRSASKTASSAKYCELSIKESTKSIRGASVGVTLGSTKPPVLRSFPFKNSFNVLCADAGLECLLVRAFFEGGFVPSVSRLRDDPSVGGLSADANGFNEVFVRTGTCGGTLANRERMDWVGATWEIYRAHSCGGRFIGFWFWHGMEIFSQTGQ